MWLSIVWAFGRMVSTYDRGLLVVAIGVVLLLNPVYFYPNGGPETTTYRIEAELVDGQPTVSEYNDHGGSILKCTGFVDDRTCLFERHVGPNGTFVVDNRSSLYRSDGEFWVSTDYQYVFFGPGYYEPRVNVSNGTVVVSLERVNRTTVAREIALQYRNAPEVVQNAVDKGNQSIRFTTRPDEESPELERELRYHLPAIVRKGDQFYGVREYSLGSEPFFLANHLTEIRIVAAFAGLLLIFWAFQFPAEDDA